MLRSVYIKNIALIKSQNIEFGGGFNVLSGETGAGKSIIVDSLMLIMGGKFDRMMLRYGEDACRVEAEFDTTEKAREYLREIDIDAEDITVISRKMTSDGKSESRINGRAVTLSAVRALGAMLLDICGQNEYQYLGLPAHHIDVLDAFARTETAPLLNEYSQQLTLLKRIDSELSEILDAEDRAENIEFMKRKLREIDKADVKEGELDELEQQRKILQSSGKIISAAENAVVFRINFVIFVRPELGVLCRVHPGMGRRGHEAGILLREQRVDMIDAGIQGLKPSGQRGFRLRALCFRHMSYQFVRPFYSAGRIVFRARGGVGTFLQIVEQGIHDGTYFPCFPVHYHIFYFHPVSLKKGKGRR